MILPILDYGSTIYDSAALKHTKKLQTVQNRGIKVVFGLPKLTPTQVLHTKAGFDTLEVRRTRATLIQAFQRSNWPEYIEKNNKPGTHMHDAITLKVPKCKTKMAQSSVGYRCAVMWNNLPADHREERKAHKFKRVLVKHLGTNNKALNEIVIAEGDDT